MPQSDRSEVARIKTGEAIRIPITDMRTEWYQALRATGTIETGQEMTGICANFPEGPAMVKCLSVEPMFVWVRKKVTA